MKMVYVEGCTCTSLTIDGVETIDLPEKDFRRIVFNMINLIDDRSLLEHLMDYCEEMEAPWDEYEYVEKEYTEDDETLKEKIKATVSKCDDFACLQHIWMRIMETMGEYESLGHCDQCGDHIVKYTIDML